MSPTKGERFLEAFNDIDDKYLKEAMNYTMKKRFNFKPIIAVAACAAFALAAVPLAKHFAGGFINNTEGTQTGTTAKPEAPIGASGKFTVLYADSASDGSSGVTIEKEIDFDGISTDFIDKTKVGTNYTVTIAGETYTGTYINSTQSDYYMDDEDNYFLAIDNKKITFSINRETKVCTRFFIADESLSKEKKFTRDECYVKAITHIKKYVNDIEDYEFKEEYEYGGKLGYVFKFFRTVNGIKTSECVEVSVNYMGIVYAHTLYGIGEMKNIDISSIDIKKVDKAVTEKLKSTYAQYPNISRKNNGVMFAKRADGKFIFIYKELVDITDDSKNTTHHDYIKLVVEID